MTIHYICEILQPDFFGQAPYSRYPLASINGCVAYMQRVPEGKDNFKVASDIIAGWNRWGRTQYHYRLYEGI